jgi:HSP20 family protein
MAITDLIPWKKREPEAEEEKRKLTVGQDTPLTFQQQVNQMFDDFSRGWGLAPFGTAHERWDLFSPRVDMVESDQEITVSVELPGLEEKDIDVSLSRDVLTIRGQKRRETEKRGRNYYHAERSYGAFERSVVLPAPVDADRAEAIVRNGVLTVTLPKESTVRAEKRVTVKAG